MTITTTPYWWEDAPSPPSFERAPPASGEIAIIGAGFTGLSAAITAARRGAEVIVIEAGQPGQGASSRNGGMAGAHPRLSLAETTKRFGAEAAKGIFNEAGPAYAHLQSLIETHKIDCDFAQTGRVQLAWTRADFEAQKAMAAEMNAHTRYRVETLEKADLSEHIVTDRYFGGLYYPDHGALHPRKFVDGLIGVARDLGVKIITQCPVHEIAPRPSGFEIRTQNGQMQARQVIIATNGYTQGKGVLRWLRRRVFPLPSYIIATEALPKARLDRLAPGSRMMVETRARHSYFRRSPDGTRILWGGRAAIRQIPPQAAVARLRQSMVEIWPDLADVQISHVWKGNTGYSFRTAPHVGNYEGMIFAMGYCGGGVVLAPYLGMKAALLALGDGAGETAYQKTYLGTKPYYWGQYLGQSPWFLQFADRWYHWIVDGHQSAQAARDRRGG